MDILKKIKKLRDERGWSNYRLAKESGVSENSLNNLFRRNNLPTVPTLESLCKGFGITLSQFFADEKEAILLRSCLVSFKQEGYKGKSNHLMSSM